jgi:PAS domain S-box-containing protein
MINNNQTDGANVHKSTAAHVDHEGRESREQFKELMAHLQQVFWIKNAADDAVLYVSPAYETISGRSCQSLHENFQTFLDAIHPEDCDRVAAAMAGQRETAGYDEEYRILRPDGAVRWIRARSYPVHDEQGQVIRFAGIAEDITERKSLDSDRARLAAIVEYSEDAIVSMSLDGIIISWNEGAERQYGYTDEEMLGRSISVLFPPDKYQEYLKIMKGVRRGEAIASHDTIRKRKDGTMIDISVGISPIENREGQAVGASKIAHDLTRVRMLEAQFRQAQKMESMGRLAAGVAHDFNNLLTVISGCSELLLDMLPSTGPAREYLMQIIDAGARASALTRQLMIFSRKPRFDLEVLELNVIVAGCEGMLKQLLGKNIEIVTALDPALCRVRTDTVQMEQVLMNLAANARDAMPEGGKLTIETSSAVLDRKHGRSRTDVEPGRYVVLAVSDTGTGMDERTRIRVFEPFFTTKEEDKGTGLGLAMVDGFARQCGGHVSVSSEPRSGTTFKIFLPEATDDIEAAPPPPIIEPATRGR